MSSSPLSSILNDLLRAVALPGGTLMTVTLKPVGEPASTKPVAADGAAPKSQEPDADGFSSFTLKGDNTADLAFTGKALASIPSNVRHGRATVQSVFVTKGGKFIGVKTGLSAWPGEKPRQELKVVPALADLIEFFGYSEQSKQLYKALDLNVIQTVE